MIKLQVYGLETFLMSLPPQIPHNMVRDGVLDHLLGGFSHLPYIPAEKCKFKGVLHPKEVQRHVPPFQSNCSVSTNDWYL